MSLKQPVAITWSIPALVYLGSLAGRFSALAAFVVAATPFSLGGITSGFWALVAGVLASLAARDKGCLPHVIPIKEATMARIPRHQGRARPKIMGSDTSDTISDRPNEPTTDSDAEGTGDRPSGRGVARLKAQEA